MSSVAVIEHALCLCAFEGRLYQKYRRFIAMLRFWNRLIAMNESRITQRIFTWLYDHSDNNWCMDIKRISTELDMLLMYMEWQNNAQNKPKLRLYRDIKL